MSDGAVIIERGRLLRAGTMTQIYNHGREDLEPYQHVAIRTRADNERLHRALLEMPHVKRARVAGNHVEAEVVGDEEAACELVAELINKGFRVLEFKQVRADLEKLFMDVTKGDVQ
jgi:ABC-2 type transport system ATP-binding protein